MAGINNQQLKNYKEYIKLKKEEASLEEKIRNAPKLGSNYDIKRIRDVRKELGPLEKAFKKVDDSVDKLIKGIADISGEMDGLSGGFKKLSDQKTDKYLNQIYGQSNKAGLAIGNLGKKFAELNKEGKGGGDLARGLSSILAIETDIRDIATDRTKLSSANLQELRSEIQATYQLLEATGNLTDEEKERLEIQLEQVNNLEMQQARTARLSALQEQGQGYQKQMADFMAQFSSKSLGALAVWTGLTKLMQFFTKGMLETQKALGTSLSDSAGFEANWTKSLGPLQHAGFLLTGVRDDVRAAAMQAAIASDNMDLMNNSAIAVSDAALAMQTGLQPEQVAELATMMSEVTDLTREGASAQLVFTQALATANNVAPSVVMADMAANATTLAAMTDGSADSMSRLAVFARKAGMEISSMSSMADTLLDLETSINAEMAASVMLNKSLNFDAARQAAARNDFESMAREIQNQLAGVNFEDLDYFQRRQLAQAAGLTDAGQLAKIMARGQTNVAETMETEAQKQLKNSNDLVNQGALTNDLLTKILWAIGALAALNAVGGIQGLRGMLPGGGGAFRGRGFKPSGPLTKAGRPDMRFSANKPPAGGMSKFMKNPLVRKAGPAAFALGMGYDAYSNYQQSGDLGQAALDTAYNNKFALGGAALGLAGGPFAPISSAAGFVGGSILDLINNTFFGLAAGGTVAKSGTYLVGEAGPELVSLGRGSQVVPNHYLGGLQAGAMGSNISFMKGTEEKLERAITVLEHVAANTLGTKGAVKDISIGKGV